MKHVEGYGGAYTTNGPTVVRFQPWLSRSGTIGSERYVRRKKTNPWRGEASTSRSYGR